ncbi:F/Y rich carboxy-terminal protein, partial [Trifolium medium]|nr:F/Y rich carboxy-terminal protein [Trifolium medium]
MGKDRYPYPVGYQAVRAHNGTTYKMEIVEGVNGPKFLISSDDGNSVSGKTPDFAWEEFQKKGCTRMKIWHGKRLSSKMDGLE